MTIIRNRIFHFLIIISTIILINFIYFGIARPANNTRIIIDKNLKPGMTLKGAIELLGPPERIKVSYNGTIVIPYNTLGLSIEAMNNGKKIEGIHIRSNFKGRFASGLKIGTDTQKILSVYNKPDIMTKDIIEYSDMGRIFQIRQGRLAGADLYLAKSKLYRQVSNKETGKYENKEIKKHEAKKTEKHKEVNVFDLFGFKAKNSFGQVIVTEIRPASAAEYGGLRIGEPVIKASLKDYGVRNIYSVGGLKIILQKAIERGNKTVNILQNNKLMNKNHLVIMEVPNM